MPHPDLTIDITTVKGFLDPAEGACLYDYALEARNPCLELGSYCGKSSIYLGTGCKHTGNVLFTVDHHRGSEEHQPGEQFHDPDLWDARLGQVDTLPELRWNLARAGLEETVIPIVTRNAKLSMHWRIPLGLLFIDGGHSEQAAWNDYRGFAGHLLPGGILLIHDVFPDPAEGGRPPFVIWSHAVASGLFEPLPAAGTLRALRRLGAG
jgi:predicted O-methyltransferase YrrM